MNNRGAAAWVVGAAVLWGTTGTAQALGGANSSPLAVGAVRLTIGGLALLLFASGGLKRPPWGWLLTAAAAMASYQVTFFAGVARAGVATGTVVAIGSAPIVAGMLAWIVRSERPDRRWWVATALAVAGVVLIGGRPGAADPGGVGLAVAAGAGYAVYALAAKQLLERLTPLAAMAAVFTLAGVVLAPLLWTADLEWLTQARGVAAALWLGLAATALAYLAFARGPRILPVGTATTLTLAEPATATLLGFAVLAERPDPLAWLGLIAVALAVVVLSTARRVTP
ncbi:carboxylate/amino acid/amine transporter [soil metagenome]